MPIQERKYPYHSENIHDILSGSAAALGWVVTSFDDKNLRMKARTSGTLRSWGEDVSAKAAIEGGWMTIFVQSEAPYQLFDWGKNEENEKMFLRELEKALKR